MANSRKVILQDQLLLFEGKLVPITHVSDVVRKGTHHSIGYGIDVLAELNEAFLDVTVGSLNSEVQGFYANLVRDVLIIFNHVFDAVGVQGVSRANILTVNVLTQGPSHTQSLATHLGLRSTLKPFNDVLQGLHADAAS